MDRAATFEPVGPQQSLRELMERMGHSSTRAAMIYQHATRERDEGLQRRWERR